MKKSRFSGQQVAFILNQVEEGAAVAVVLRKSCVSEAIYYNWRKKHGGVMPSVVKRLKQLVDENPRLRKVAADVSLD